MEQSEGRRISRRERRRAHVYEIALVLFVERGFESTTMEQIAEAADVARATVFNYYPRKSAFLDEWTSRRRARASQALENEGTHQWPVGRVLARYLTELASLSTLAYDETAVLMTAAVQWTDVLAHPALAKEFALHVRRAKGSGEVHPTANPELVGTVLAASYFSILSQWIALGPDAFSLEARLHGALDVVLGGILEPLVVAPPMPVEHPRPLAGGA